MAWDDLGGSQVRYAHSPVESERFAVSVGRVTCGLGTAEGGADADATASRLATVARDAPDDVLVVRYPAAVTWGAAALSRSGRSLLPAGTLVYWSAPAADVGAGDVSGVRVVRADQVAGEGHDAADVLDRVVANSFAGYGNHYAVNPLLDAGAALDGYRDWARRTLDGQPDDVLVLLDDRGAPIGVATCVASRGAGRHLEVLLAGLVDAAQGRGLYGRLLAACADEARRRGLHDLLISTQAHNVRVQRAWVKAGLRPVAAVETVHAVRPAALQGVSGPGATAAAAGG